MSDREALPNVLDEHATIEQAVEHGMSIARFGDGELKLCRGVSCKTQRHDPLLTTRLREVLRCPDKRVMVCIPRIWQPRPEFTEQKERFWRQYRGAHTIPYLRLSKLYGSSFISRDDSAPDIMDVGYFAMVRLLWEGRDVVFVHGTKKGRVATTGGLLGNAASLTEIQGPKQSAWSKFDTLREAILAEAGAKPKPLAVLALGDTATVLAHDLQVKHDLQALDIGHMGTPFRVWSRSEDRDDDDD